MEMRYPQALLVSCEVPWNDDEELLEDVFRTEVRATLAKGFNHLYVFGTAGEGYAVTLSQFKQIVEVFWDETVTWNSRPRVSAEDVLQVPVTAQVGERQAFDVTDILQRAVADGRSQVAFAIQAEADAGSIVWAFTSREGAGAPLLILDGGGE